MPTVPTPPGATPAIPVRGNYATFSTLIGLWINWFTTTAPDLIYGYCLAAYNNAMEALGYAQSASASAAAAANFASNAAAVANYKGAWSSLSGALATPATVSHNGGLWILVVNTGNVASITPGVSNQWLPATTVFRSVPVSGTSATALAWDCLELENVASSTALLPPNPARGDEVMVIPLNGLASNEVDGNGNPIHGLMEAMRLDNPEEAVTFRFTNPTKGWRKK